MARVGAGVRTHPLTRMPCPACGSERMLRVLLVGLSDPLKRSLQAKERGIRCENRSGCRDLVI